MQDEKVERMKKQNQYHIILCILLLLQSSVLYTVSYEVDDTDWRLQSSWF